MIMFWMLVLTAIIALLIFGIIKALDNDRAAEVIVFLVFATMLMSMILGVVVHMYTMVSYDDYRKGYCLYQRIKVVVE